MLDVSEGYSGDYRAEWFSDVRVPTRLGDEQVVVRLARVVGDDVIEPWVPEGVSLHKRWALSELRIAAYKKVERYDDEPRLKHAIEAAKASWPEYERSVSILPLALSGRTWRGRRRSLDGKDLRCAYSAELGLIWEAVVEDH